MKLNEKRIINDIRLLALDMINNAGSGHPGIALDLAPTMYTLLAYHLKFDLERKSWCNRDRLIVSSGHASALLYASLFCSKVSISSIFFILSVYTTGIFKKYEYCF